MEVLNLNEFNEKYLKLCEDTLNALEELKSLTDKEIIFRIIDNSEARGYFKLKIKLARSFMENHIIVINKDMVKDKDELNYYIVHEVMHGLRVFNADPKERKALSVHECSLKKIVEDIIETMDKSVVMSMDIDDLKMYCRSLIFNINSLLVNNPVDARIELEIYSKYPSLRKMQKKVQKDYLKELQVGFVDSNARKYTPSWILDKVNLMNYCYMQKITPIIGKAWTSKVNGVIDERFKDDVKEMMYYLDKEDLGQTSDNKTIIAWSEILGMGQYTRLIDFENVGYDYVESN